MPSTLNPTVTAPVGAGETATALSFTDVREVLVDARKEMLFVKLASGRVAEFAYDTIATVTWVIAAKVATITFST